MTQAMEFVAPDAGVEPPSLDLDATGAVAILGTNSQEVASQAMRVAAEIARRRRVAVLDLLGDNSPLTLEVGDDDPHGISDAMRYGVSLSHILRQVPRVPNLFVVTGGVESPLHADVLSHRRWDQWIGQFRDAGALMLVAAPADHQAITPLLDRLDGVIVVGETLTPLTRAPLLGRVRLPRPATPRPTQGALPTPAARIQSRRTGRRMALGAVALVVVAAATWAGRAAWLTRRAPLTAEREGVPPITMPGDAPTASASATAVDTVDVAQWAVELASVNSAVSALLRVRQAVDSLPVPTYSPTLLGAGAAPWYRLIAGGYPQAESAESLLVALRDRGVVRANAGRVIRAPYAWLVEDSVPPEVTPERLILWRLQGVPAYALYGAVGLARIYVGAFESVTEARLLVPTLDSLAINATLTFRVGSIR